jgi:hypothetical protein
MKSQFGKVENEDMKCWSKAFHLKFSLTAMHYFGLLDIQKKYQHTPALPPRLGGLLATARSFERFE